MRICIPIARLAARSTSSNSNESSRAIVACAAGRSRVQNSASTAMVAGPHSASKVTTSECRALFMASRRLAVPRNVDGGASAADEWPSSAATETAADCGGVAGTEADGAPTLWKAECEDEWGCPGSLPALASAP